MCFYDDFNTHEWHFSAIAHGKKPCDGSGSTVKMLTATAGL